LGGAATQKFNGTGRTASVVFASRPQH
jgi:hypothetical protein